MKMAKLCNHYFAFNSLFSIFPPLSPTPTPAPSPNCVTFFFIITFASAKTVKIFQKLGEVYEVGEEARSR